MGHFQHRKNCEHLEVPDPKRCEIFYNSSYYKNTLSKIKKTEIGMWKVVSFNINEENGESELYEDLYFINGNILDAIASSLKFNNFVSIKTKEIGRIFYCAGLF